MPDVPPGASAGPGRLGETGVRPLGVDESDAPLPGVEVRSEPDPVEVEGVVVEVLVDGDVVLEDDDWAAL